MIDWNARVSGKILDRLGGADDDGRIMAVFRLADGNFRIIEMCDTYFMQDLTPAELVALGNEIIAAAGDCTEREHGKR